MKTTPSLSLALLVLLLAETSAAQNPSIYEVPLEERIERSDVVVEARVLSRESFWNADRTRILSASVLDVYRVFKGDAGDRISLVTPGGRVGFVAQRASHALEPVPGDVGIFFAERLPGSGSNGKSDGPVFRPVAGAQGLVRYDESRGSAHDLFETYVDIEGDLHRTIAAKTAAPVVRKSYAVPVAPERKDNAKVGLVPSITSVSPGTVKAGVGNLLTISGSGFEAYDGGTNSTVFFPNADNGGSSLTGAPGSQVSSWTDSQIQVRVPSGAGTGQITVRNASGQQATSSASITVEYSVTNLLYNGNLRRTSLADKSGGGYSLRFSSSTADGGVNFATSLAVEPFERALLSWQQNTGLNMRTDGADIDSNRVAPNSPNDIIMFESSADALPSGVLGRAYTGFVSCDGVTWIVQGIDIQFRRDGNAVTWNFGPDSNSGNRADFESVALHELGHAHQLGHIIAPGKVMHYALTNGTDIRVLDGISDIAGGDDAIDFAQPLGVSCAGRFWTGMDRLVGVAVENEGPAEADELSAAWPNPARGSTTFTVRVTDRRPVTVDVFDVLGRNVERLHEGPLVPGVDNEFMFRAGGHPSGIYMYRVAGADFRASRHFVLMK